MTIWGPAAPELPLRDRIARYLSAPLTPVEIRELPCQVDFREADSVDSQEVFVMAVPSFPATAFAQLVLPSGEAVNLEAPA